jgi:two-component system, chemotaxis family, protein-glutamate methylesterase/glutaminase
LVIRYQVRNSNAWQIEHARCQAFGFVPHRFSPESLGEQHREALERALWTAIRKLKERVVLHEQLVERKKRNKGEEELKERLEESVVTAERDLKLLHEILERI